MTPWILELLVGFLIVSGSMGTFLQNSLYRGRWSLNKVSVQIGNFSIGFKQGKMKNVFQLLFVFWYGSINRYIRCVESVMQCFCKRFVVLVAFVYDTLSVKVLKHKSWHAIVNKNSVVERLWSLPRRCARVISCQHWSGPAWSRKLYSVATSFRTNALLCP